MSELSLHILGTAAARPWPGAPTSAVLVRSGRNQILIDCGEGTLLQLPGNAFGERGLDAVAITHMHGDHLYGLPGLLTSMTLAGRKRALWLVGPAGLQSYLESVFRWSHARLGFDLRFVTLPSADYEAGRALLTLPELELHACPLRHRIESFGYLVHTHQPGRRLQPGVVADLGIPYAEIPAIRNGADWRSASGTVYANDALTLDPHPTRSIAYLLDTAPLDAYPSSWPPPDILVHDATFAPEHADLARETGHSTVDQAAAFAKTSGAGRLLVTHRSIRYADPESLLTAARAVFPQTRWAVDGETVIV